MTGALKRSVLTVALLAAAGCGRSGTAPAEAEKAEQAAGSALKIPFPATQSIGDRQSLTCQSLIDSDISGSGDKSLTNGIEGKVTRGGNMAAVSWNDSSTLTFLSGAAFEAGVAQGVAFSIVSNSKDELVAYFFDGSSINTFVLNKRNGLALWSKIRSTFPVYDAPTGATSYMQCQ